LESGTWDIFWYQINQGFGMAFLFVPLTTLTMEAVPREETGYATSLYSVMRNIGSSMGISFVTTWLARTSQFHQDVLSANLTPGSLPTQQMLQGMTRYMQFRGFDIATATQKGEALLYQLLQQQASLLSYIDVFHLMGILFLVSIPLILFMRRTRRSRSELRGTLAEH